LGGKIGRLGEEQLHLQIGWTDQRIWDGMSKAPQTFVVDF